MTKEDLASAEPNDWKLPHDFVAAGATFRKGVSAKTLALRVENLWTAAFGPMPTKAEQDANFVRLTGVTTPAVAPALERETAEPPALIDEPKEPAGSFELGRAHGITHVVDSLHANPEKWGYRAIASTPPPEQASTPNEAPPEGEQPG